MTLEYTTKSYTTEELATSCLHVEKVLANHFNLFPSGQAVLLEAAKELQRLAKVEKEHEALLKSIEEENDTYSFDWLDFYGGKIRRQTL